MTFSPQLEAKFAKLLESYPTGRQRAAMIPMLLYAQDEIGSVTDELVEEVAQRVGVTPLQVNEVVSYYSMLHRQPLGKYHVQICTNISCLLHDADQLLEHTCRKLGREPRRHRGRAVFDRRSGVHGRVLLGAGDSNQLRFSSLRDAGETRPAFGRPEEEAIEDAV